MTKEQEFYMVVLLQEFIKAKTQTELNKIKELLTKYKVNYNDFVEYGKKHNVIVKFN